jgi:hypothetical protein
VKVTEAERKRRSKVARELAIAAQHLRHYQRADLARQVDEVADGIYASDHRSAAAISDRLCWMRPQLYLAAVIAS